MSLSVRAQRSLRLLVSQTLPVAAISMGLLGASIAGPVATGAVTGTVVVEGTTQPISKVAVTAVRTDNGSVAATGTTDSTGRYVFSALAPGQYRLQFQPSAGAGYAPEWYSNRYTQATANSLTITAGTKLSGKNAGLALGGLAATPTPTVSGTMVAGATLTASAGAWAPSPVALSYAWQRNGVAVPGATSSTYKLLSSDVGARFTVAVTGSKTGYKTSTVVSVPTPAVLSKLSSTPTPVVTGSALVGSTLQAGAGAWGPSPVELRYQWLRNGTAVPGATASSYVLGEADAGAAISVAVTGVKAGYSPVTKKSVATPEVLRPLTQTPTPSMGGVPTVTGRLTAGAGSWEPAPVTISYQWLRNGEEIDGATAVRYSVTQVDVGSVLSVEVTGSQPGYQTVTTTSPSTKPVQDIH